MVAKGAASSDFVMTQGSFGNHQYRLKRKRTDPQLARYSFDVHSSLDKHPFPAPLMGPYPDALRLDRSSLDIITNHTHLMMGARIRLCKSIE